MHINYTIWDKGNILSPLQERSSCSLCLTVFRISFKIHTVQKLMLRNYKPERSNHEEKFVPGIDPGLKDWLKVRQSGRDAQKRGGTTCIVTCDTSYKLKQFWRSELLKYAESNNNNSESQPIYTTNKSTTLSQFQEMLALRCSFEDIVTIAMKKRNIAFIELALKHGIDINYRMGHSRRTMLHTACRDGDMKKVDYLISQGANLNLQDFQGSTALHLSIQPISTFHTINIIIKLIENNCKLNIQDKNGKTPLHIACIIGSEEIISLLLKSHALPYILDKKSKLAIDYTHSHVNRFFCEALVGSALKSHQERMWARIIARNVTTSILRLTATSCEVCKRNLADCAALKQSRYRYWLLVHNRLNKEVWQAPTSTTTTSGSNTNSMKYSRKGSGLSEEFEDEW